jgi:PilZ domain
MDVSNGAEAEQPERPETCGVRGFEEREAFRVRIRLPVHVESPMQAYCETVDMSVLGARFDRELPCVTGVDVNFVLEIPGSGADKPGTLKLQAEVVRVCERDTGVRFTNLTVEQKHAVRDLVNSQQRMIVAGRRAAREGLGRVSALSCRLA